MFLLNNSVADIASLVCVSERTVWRYIALFRQTGDVEPQQREYGPKKMLGELEQLTLLHLIIIMVSTYMKYKQSSRASLEFV